MPKDAAPRGGRLPSLPPSLPLRLPRHRVPRPAALTDHGTSLAADTKAHDPLGAMLPSGSPPQWRKLTERT